MGTPRFRALVEDAIFQVFDNSVFRILAIVVLLPILLTFLVSATPNGLSILFGTWSWPWSDLGMSGADSHLKVIDGVLALLIDGAVGTFGVLFCIAATAFFVPRMVEKGAADLLFHKPVSRFAFYLSRYFAGLLFVAILALILVVGMYAGLLIVSGHSAPGLLWSALTLTYLFGLVFSVCMLVGVVTRSTVASILITILFFLGNGCVHQGWQVFEATQEFGMGAMSGETVKVEIEDSTDEDPEELAIVADEDDRPAGVRILHQGLSVAHLILPKTTDADALAQKLRKSVSPPDFVEEEIALRIDDFPVGWKKLEGQTAAAPVEGLGEVRLAVAHKGGATTTIRRRPLEQTEKVFRSGRKRMLREKLSDATTKLSEALLEAALADLSGASHYPQPFESPSGDAEALPTFGTVNARFTFTLGDEAVELVAFTRDDWLYTLDVRRPSHADPDEAYELVDSIDSRPVREDWYAEKFVSGAPLPYNPWFSVLSSLAFAALMLGLGAWRLSRIDF